MHRKNIYKQFIWISFIDSLIHFFCLINNIATILIMKDIYLFINLFVHLFVSLFISQYLWKID